MLMHCHKQCLPSIGNELKKIIWLVRILAILQSFNFHFANAIRMHQTEIIQFSHIEKILCTFLVTLIFQSEYASRGYIASIWLPDKLKLGPVHTQHIYNIKHVRWHKARARGTLPDIPPQHPKANICLRDKECQRFLMDLSIIYLYRLLTWPYVEDRFCPWC